MNRQTKLFYDCLKRREYRLKRKDGESMRNAEESFEYETDFLREAVMREEPFFLDGDDIGFNRSVSGVISTKGLGGNLTPDYERIVRCGFDALADEIRESMEKHSGDAKRTRFAKAMLSSLDAGKVIAEKYCGYARAQGLEKLASALEKIPQKGAASLYEACVFLKLCVFLLRLSGVAHITLGRFDMYMYPYYLADRENGVSDADALETVERFFISLGVDSDLYPGVQQGDNGQSMVLGGFDENGNDMYNELSELCMEASCELCIIDPKINLRVGEKTPPERYERATLLTKKGLGFPQYCNDDIVVKGLVSLGYEKSDAVNYTVAACWEYMVPGCSADIPNIETMDFPRIVGEAITLNIEKCESFDELMTCVKRNIYEECKRIALCRKELEIGSYPLLSAMTRGCAQVLLPLYHGGAKYFNFGCHGAGIATAADSLAAVKKTIYNDKALTKKELLSALSNNYENAADIRKLLMSCPKMGNNDGFVDSLACELMKAFSDGMNGRSNFHGGIWRAGTGSAMEYVNKGEKCPATADGRLSGYVYASSFSPAIGAKTDGLLSVMQSFTKYDMTKAINGGPLTIELHDTVFRNDIGIKKTAALVRKYILLGGHQLQINSVSREKLLDAKVHPENYADLIVRVWGWSGYFTELDPKYQDHIIRRTLYD